jgi:hypothetical protein
MKLPSMHTVRTVEQKKYLELVIYDKRPQTYVHLTQLNNCVFISRR